MTQSKHPFQVGDKIAGNYEVLDILGEGAVGTVYLVKNLQKDMLVALKALNPDLAGSPKAQAIFLREAKIWTSLKFHPHIVYAAQIENDGEENYLVMEYVGPGNNWENSLAGYLRLHTPDTRQILEWAIQFCEGMKYAYRRGIRAHRDIKPQNILLTRKKVLKISDFGLASVLSVPVTGSLSDIPQYTGTRDPLTSCVGTYLYMSPEHYQNADLCDERSDIYSFGIVLFQMASGGKLPFLAEPPANASKEETDRFVASMQKLHNESPPPSIRSPLDDIIQMCLAKKRNNRYDSFDSLQTALEDLVLSQGCENIARPTKTFSYHDAVLEENYTVGLTYQRLSRFNDAFRSLAKAAGLGLDTPEFIVSLAQSHISIGQNAEALDLYNQALQSYIGEPHLMYGKGMLLASLGNHKEASRCFARSLPELHCEPSFDSQYWDPFVRMAENSQERSIYEGLLDTPIDKWFFNFSKRRDQSSDPEEERKGRSVSWLSSLLCHLR